MVTRRLDSLRPVAVTVADAGVSALCGSGRTRARRPSCSRSSGLMSAMDSGVKVPAAWPSRMTRNLSARSFR